MFVLQTIFLMLFGLGIGTLGTLLGVGGGWLHVPFLILLFSFSPQEAIGTSIGVIFFNTLAGSIIYYHKKSMDFSLAKKLAVAILPGAIIGPFVVQSYSTSFFLFFFSLVLFVIAYYLFFKGSHFKVLPDYKYNRVTTIVDNQGNKVSYSTSLELGVIGTFVIGFVSNLLGIGGGIIHVPFLIMFLRLPTHLALGTSHFILCVSSFVAMLLYWSFGNIKIDFMMPMALGSIVGARVGAGLAQNTSGHLIRKLIAMLLVGLGIKMVSHVL